MNEWIEYIDYVFAHRNDVDGNKLILLNNQNIDRRRCFVARVRFK